MQIETSFSDQVIEKLTYKNFKNPVEIKQSWDRYFSGLSASEYAAGRECYLSAVEFGRLGRMDLAIKYRQFAEEEEDHGRLGAAMGSRIYPLTPTAIDVFTGNRFIESGHALSNRLMVIHSIFEPSALAILGFLNKYSEQIFDRLRSNIVKACTALVIRDEMGHVLDGSRLIKELIDDHVIPVPSAETIACVKYHFAFVKSGFLSFFSKVPEYRPILRQILLKFESYVNQSVRTYGLQF
jgi:hypothetical protein